MKKNFWRKITCALLVVVLIAIPIAVPVSSAQQTQNQVFSDVAEDHWAYDYIYKFQELKIVDGYPDGTFRPDKEVTTAEFIKMVSIIYWMAFGGKYKRTLENYIDENGQEKIREKPISEVYRGHWAEKYLQSLDSVIYADRYTPEILDMAITREEASDILFNCYMLTNRSDPTREAFNDTEMYLKEFSDETDISDTWRDYRRCLNGCIQYGFFTGFDDGKLRPQANLTRAQAAKIISIYYDKLYSYMKSTMGSNWVWEH